MHQRVKWHEADWPFGMPSLSKALKAINFTPKADDGFILHTTRKQEIIGEYIEKIQIKEKIIDPFGNETEYDRVEFLTTRFSFSSTFPQIEIRNPPRSLQSFQARLSEACDFSIYIKPIDVDPIRWAKKFSDLADLDLITKAVQFDNIFINNDIKGEMLIRANSNLFPILNQLLPWEKHEIKKVHCVSGKFSERYAAIFNNKGSLSFSQEFEDWVREFGIQSIRETR